MMDPIDQKVLAAVCAGGQATYVIRNRVHRDRETNFTTAQVLRRLKRLEAGGYVVRVPSSYSVMISWALSSREINYLSGAGVAKN